ncbi:MAG: putative repeat protein (TIGR03806 family) [Polyangiales bacterium]|jgi:uncharacterized repeat protein (TIGR03806 family)
MKNAIFAASLVVVAFGCGDEPLEPLDGGGEDVPVFDGGAEDVSVFDGGPDVPLGPLFEGPVVIDLSERPPALLSDMRLMAWDGQQIRYNDGLVPYELNTPLFSDFALKARAIYVPTGSSIEWVDEGPLTFPIGSIIIKTFYFADDFRALGENEHLVETRVLRLGDEGWEAWPYIWNEAQDDAVLMLGGGTRAIDFIDYLGDPQTANYLIPQRNQCSTCHERNVGVDEETEMTPIGPRGRHLNREYPYESGAANQLQHMADLGMLSGLPPLAGIDASYDYSQVERLGAMGIPAEDVDRAARDYLDVNCSHCHDPLGPQGVTSQLFLNYDSEDAFRLGICKRPGSAGAGTGGLTYDLVPGVPDESILLFRMETVDLGAIMPLIGRSLQDREAVALIRRWIAAMPTQSCE